MVLTPVRLDGGHHPRTMTKGTPWRTRRAPIRESVRKATLSDLFKGSLVERCSQGCFPPFGINVLSHGWSARPNDDGKRRTIDDC
jgi:hypothetical protein